MAEREKGIVKWFSVAKGYGFIQRSGQRRDVFVHASGIRAADKTLAEGDEVEFSVEDLPRGPSAVDVVVL